MTVAAESPWLRADWMQTFTGKAFVPLDPDPAMICSEDIAHALSLLCRYGGHSSRFYSVAEHCVLMSEALAAEGHSIEVQRWALMHDSAEAYLGDVIRPVKRSMPTYRDAEAVLLATIAQVYNLPLVADGRAGYPTVVAQADNRILLNEREELLSAPPQAWDLEDGLRPLPVEVEGWKPKYAENAFLGQMEKFGLLPSA